MSVSFMMSSSSCYTIFTFISTVACKCNCRVYIIAVIRPYVPTLFLGAFILGSAGGGMYV